MLQPGLIVLAVLALLELEADAVSIKWHGGGIPLNNPAAWVDDYMPCARDLLAVPAYYPAVLPLPAELAIRGFQFPREGALLLAEDSTITLGTGSAALNAHCESDELRAELKPPKTSKWFDPSSWSDRLNVNSKNASIVDSALLTDLERVPCDDEHIVIRGNTGALSFDLENVQRLRLGQLIVAGSSISRMYLQELLQRDLGRLMFHNAEQTTVEYYHGELCGCHKDFEQLIEPICYNVEAHCEVPHCATPVRPFGSCCFHCGALLTMPGPQCKEQDRKKLEKYIRAAMAREQLTDALQLHVSYVGSRFYGNMLQAFVQERGAYSELSVGFMQRLLQPRNGSSFAAVYGEYQTRYAGSVQNPNVTFGSVLLILFCVVFVSIVAIIMLAHFMPEHPYLNRIPQWIHDPRHWRWRHYGLRLRRNLLFNRFDNAAPSGSHLAGSAAERLAVIGYDAQSGEVRERSFNNPMFEQEPEPEPEELEASASAAAETATKFRPDVDALAPSVETGELDSCSGEEQELTEINLESTDEESEVEAETKE
ncbi:hypothetical protein KR222_003749 [Zaprionus bogoriensis]|nr:hypothetical protein KR222_003749 [Zaprionus bogoriensis]